MKRGQLTFVDVNDFRSRRVQPPPACKFLVVSLLLFQFLSPGDQSGAPITSTPKTVSTATQTPTTRKSYEFDMSNTFNGSNSNSNDDDDDIHDQSQHW